MARRGRLHAYDTLHASRTALVTIDLPNYFVKDGFPSTVPAARGIIPAVNQAAQALRDKGGTVIRISTSSDTMLIAGTVTNVCCESTARDAMMLNFKTVMLADALAAKLPTAHVQRCPASLTISATS